MAAAHRSAPRHVLPTRSIPGELPTPARCRVGRSGVSWLSGVFGENLVGPLSVDGSEYRDVRVHQRVERCADTPAGTVASAVNERDRNPGTEIVRCLG
jgi:hypothetical protein